MYVTQAVHMSGTSKKPFPRYHVCLFNNYLKYSVIFLYFCASVKLFFDFLGGNTVNPQISQRFVPAIHLVNTTISWGVKVLFTITEKYFFDYSQNKYYSTLSRGLCTYLFSCENFSVSRYAWA